MSSFSSPDGPQKDLPPIRPTNPPQASPPTTPQVGGGNGWLFPLLGCGAVVCVGLLLICGGVYSAYQVASIEEIFDVAPPAPPVEEVAVNLLLLDGDWKDDADRKTHSKVGRFIAQLEEASANNDQEAFMRLVDLDAHMERCYAAFRHALDYRTKFELDEIERKNFKMPEAAAGFRVAAIDQPNDYDMLVYAYPQVQEMADAPFVFHLRNDASGHLKLVDWQEIPERIWAAEFNGLGAGPIDTDFERTRQESIYTDLSKADEAINIGDYDAAEVAIRKAESRAGIHQLADRNRYLTALRWQWMQRSDEALRVCNESRTTGAYPWLDYLRAEIYAARDEHEKVLECVDRYEKYAGFHWRIKLFQTNALAALGRTDEAAATTLEVVNHRPEHYESINALFSNVPANQLPETLENSPKTQAFMQRLVDHASTFLTAKKVESYDTVRAFVAKHDKGGSLLVDLDANRLSYQGKLAEALALYEQRLAGIDEDSDEFSTALWDVASLSLRIYPPKDAYDNTKFPRQWIALLYDDAEYDQELIEYDAVADVLRRHIENDPSDPMNHQYKVFLAIEEQDWSQAKTESLAALNALDESEEDEYVATRLRYSLRQASYHLNQWRELYREAEDKDEVYLNLSRMMDNFDDLAAMKELNRLHDGNSESLWLKYYKIRVAEKEAAGEDSERTTKELIRRYRYLKAENALTEEIYPYTLRSRITALTVKCEDWREAFNDAEDAESLFHDFVERFQQQNDEKGLSEFLALYRSRFPDSTPLRTHDLEELVSQRKFDQVIEKTNPWPPIQNTREYLPVYQWRRLRFQSQIASGDFAGARQTADLPAIDHTLHLALLMAQGDSAGVKQLLANEEAGVACYLPPEKAWMTAPSFADFVNGPEFRNILKEHPPWLTATPYSQRAMLLFKEPAKLTKESIEASLQQAGHDKAVVEMLNGDALASSTARITFPDQMYFVTWSADDPEKLDEPLQAPASYPTALATAMSESPHWISLEEVAGPISTRSSEFYSIANLLADGAQVIFHEDQNYFGRWGAFSQGFEPADDHGKKLLASIQGSEQYIFIPTGNSSLESTNLNNETLRRCQQMVSGEVSGKAQIMIRCGSALERHWLTITDVKHSGWGYYELTGKFDSDSQINPFVRSGDVVRIDSYGIVGWRD